MKIAQPRVARNELPWVGIGKTPTLKELNPAHGVVSCHLLQPFQGWIDLEPTQGGRGRANPGLYDRNPVGVAATSD